MSRSDAPLNENDVNCKPPDRPTDPDVILNRSKKGKKKQRLPDAADVTARPEDIVRLAPVPRDDPAPAQDGLPVQLSQKDKANQLQLSEDKLSVTGWKGYRTVRATRGVYQGTWYCEVEVAHLGDTGHCRLGWCTKKAELQAPVGFDVHGFAYRDLEGSKVQKSWREDYGSAYAQGDVIGMYFHMPPGGRPFEMPDKPLVRYKGAMYVMEEKEEEPKPWEGSVIGFTKNGEWQGSAFSDFLEGTYYPAASLYTLPEQTEGATVTFNFGPDFKYSMPEVEGLPPPRAMCEVVEAQDEGQGGDTDGTTPQANGWEAEQTDAPVAAEVEAEQTGAPVAGEVEAAVADVQNA